MEDWLWVLFGIAGLGYVYTDYRRDKDMLRYLLDHEGRIAKVEASIESYMDGDDKE